MPTSVLRVIARSTRHPGQSGLHSRIRTEILWRLKPLIGACQHQLKGCRGCIASEALQQQRVGIQGCRRHPQRSSITVVPPGFSGIVSTTLIETSSCRTTCTSRPTRNSTETPSHVTRFYPRFRLIRAP